MNDTTLLLDGSLGDMITRNIYEEMDYRGDYFFNVKRKLLRNNTLLNVTKKEDVLNIHKSFIRSGSNIIRTNTFNSNKIGQSKYGLSASSYDLTKIGVSIAKKACRELNSKSGVAGVISQVDETNIDFKDLVSCYVENINALLEGESDYIYFQNNIKISNSKAIITAIKETSKVKKYPLMVYSEVSNNIEEVIDFLKSIESLKPYSIGITHSINNEDIDLFTKSFTKITLGVCPNIGTPNPIGEYMESSEDFYNKIKELDVGIIGGGNGVTSMNIDFLNSKKN